MRASELIKISNFKKYIFYGPVKFTRDIEYKNNIYQFSKIDWNNVERLGYDDLFYNYSQAISSLLVEGHRNATNIASIIDKVLKFKIKLIKYENETLYIYVNIY